jgi:hypothetical protein
MVWDSELLTIVITNDFCKNKRSFVPAAVAPSQVGIEDSVVESDVLGAGSERHAEVLVWVAWLKWKFQSHFVVLEGMRIK